MYGTWHVEIVAYNQDTDQFSAITGPSGTNVWQLAFYGEAPFNNGSATFTVPAAGNYVFFIRAAGWLSPWPQSPFVGVQVAVN